MFKFYMQIRVLVYIVNRYLIVYIQLRVIRMEIKSKVLII